ncbi:ribonuclease M5 [Borrelia nietonii YOR]|uniref:ribonuclease M5 n=1 Tax=Borrelia nietonii TaxID=3117462 RepID=UPI0009B85E13|nr:ribonuclease M5 [Borrelia nietonii]UPA09557.1 ribonuclease M5 [Borrelia nietonii YOR]
MEQIKEIIVVEGKDDSKRIKELFKCTIVETGGLYLKQSTINVLKKAIKTNGIIIFTDSDKAGDLIRQQILKRMNYLNQDKIKHAHLKSKDQEVEMSSKLEIATILRKIGTFDNEKQKEGLSLNDLIELGITGAQSKKRREQIQKHFNLGNGNNKKLLERLNYFKIKREDIEKVILIKELRLPQKESNLRPSG